MDVTFQGVDFHVRDDQDIHGLHELWTGDDPYRIYGRDPHTVVDIGGNIGLFAVLICHLYPAAHVTTYEAYTPNYDILLRNIGGYNITAYNLAIWCDDQGVAMELNPWNYGCTSVDRAATTPTIASITLDTALAAFESVDILKVDTEGSEYEIFAAASRDTMLKVDYLCMELHDGPVDTLLAKLDETHTRVANDPGMWCGELR